MTNKDKFIKLAWKPHFKRFEIMHENLVLVEMAKVNVVLDRPIYIGFSVLELAKLHMYKFHYNVMKPYFGENLQLLFTDTDSLTYKLTTEDLHNDMQQLSQHMDLSVYPQNHSLHNMINAKVIGKMKDETAPRLITRFVGLRSKLYCCELEDDSVKNAMKGIRFKLFVFFYFKRFRCSETCLSQEKM